MLMKPPLNKPVSHLLLPFSVQGSVFSRIDALLGGLEWEMESTTVTHSCADWWDLLLPLAYTPDRRDQQLLVSHPTDTGK